MAEQKHKHKQKEETAKGIMYKVYDSDRAMEVGDKQHLWDGCGKD